MKTIEINQPTELEMSWFAAAAEGAVCVKLGDGREFVIEPRDEDFEREVASLAANDKFMEVINRRSEKTHTHEELLKEFGLS